MNLRVESVSVCRAVDSLDTLLAKRTAALLKLEEAWTAYVGNPSTVESYDPSLNVRGDAVSSRVANEDRGESGGLPRLVVPHRARPTLRPTLFGRQVDALEWLETQFREADEAVRRKRRVGKFNATDVAFVTFEEMASAVSGFFVCGRWGWKFAGDLVHQWMRDCFRLSGRLIVFLI